jgi:lipopolysaccharide transport system permease protein
LTQIKQKPTPDTEDWDIIISARRSLWHFPLWELRRFSDLIRILVRRDFVAVYKQTILGPLWHILQPLFMTLIFTLVFGRIIGLETDGIPALLFYLSGIIVWNFFSESVNSIAGTFTDNQAIFGKVYFPRLVIPISGLLFRTLKFGIQFALLLCFYIFFIFQGHPLQPNLALVVLLPLLLLQIALLSLGTGLIIAALTVRYRDLHNLVNFALQLWMYATPVFYSAKQIPAKFAWLYQINPVAAIITNFRYILFSGDNRYFTNAPLFSTLLSTIITLSILFFALILFNRVERTFIDTV